MHPLHIGFTPDFDREKYLYHYTGMDTAVNHILYNKTLRFNTLANVNDPMESDPNRWVYSSGVKDKNNLVAIRDRLYDHFENRTKVVCFSRDVQGDWRAGCCSADYYARGHSKPRMWATYGDDHKGVCLIFDRERLGRAFEKGLNERGQLLQGAIKYGDIFVPSEETGSVIDLESFEENFDMALQHKIEDHYRTYFLYKHVDWSTEAEYRFIITGGGNKPIELEFNDSLVGVAVGMKSVEKAGYLKAIGDITQAMDVPCRLMGYGRHGVSVAPVNEAAKEIGPRVANTKTTS